MTELNRVITKLDSFYLGKSFLISVLTLSKLTACSQIIANALVSISSTFYARPFWAYILVPKNLKPKTQLCNFLAPKFCMKNVQIKS
jgi:hypothetical protein